jgi:hypothetical protein
MNRNRFHPMAIIWAAAIALALASMALGQTTTTQTTQTTRVNNQNPNTSLRSVPSGSKMKFKGVVIGRDADVFTIRDRSRADYQTIPVSKRTAASCAAARSIRLPTFSAD